MKCGLYIRCFYESFYLNWFINYYINLGFDYIIILKADNIKYQLPKQYLDKVYIKNVENRGNSLLPDNLYLIKNSIIDWVFMIDIDEILVLKHNNIKKYLKDLNNKDCEINNVEFRWLMMERYDNRNMNLSQSYHLYNLYSNSLYKSFTKVKDIISFQNPHKFNVTNEKKLVEKNYENYLLHIHTRSLNNMILKSFITILHEKNIKNMDEFKKLVNNVDYESNVLDKFKKCIGLKATLPYTHSRGEKIKVNKCHKLFNEKIVRFKKEKKILYKMLKENGIYIKNYELFIHKLEIEVKHHFLSTS